MLVGFLRWLRQVSFSTDLRTRKEVMETGTQEKVSTPLNHFFFLPYARIVSI